MLAPLLLSAVDYNNFSIRVARQQCCRFLQPASLGCRNRVNLGILAANLLFKTSLSGGLFIAVHCNRNVSRPFYDVADCRHLTRRACVLCHWHTGFYTFHHTYSHKGFLPSRRWCQFLGLLWTTSLVGLSTNESASCRGMLLALSHPHRDSNLGSHSSALPCANH
jgi:hypothetical protein